MSMSILKLCCILLVGAWKYILRLLKMLTDERIIIFSLLSLQFGKLQQREFAQSICENTREWISKIHALRLIHLRMALILYKDKLAVLYIFDIYGLNESLLSVINHKRLTFNGGFIKISEIGIFSSSVLFLFNRRLFSNSQLLIVFAQRQIS